MIYFLLVDVNNNFSQILEQTLFFHIIYEFNVCNDDFFVLVSYVKNKTLKFIYHKYFFYFYKYVKILQKYYTNIFILCNKKLNHHTNKH